MKRFRLIYSLLAAIVVLGLSCQSETLSSDTSLRLTFSHDSLLFDTVFTAAGSSTQRIMVYNRNTNALCIQRVTLSDGRYFHINLDGENTISNLHDIQLNGGDSLFLFVRVNIDPLSSNTPVLVTDTLLFRVNDQLQRITFQAFGQDVRRIRGKKGLMVYSDLYLDNSKPYVLFDTIAVAGTLNIESGTTLYMHAGSLIYAYGDVKAVGTREQPVIVRGDRTDRLFDSVPYRVASGQWNGIYLLHTSDLPTPTYNMNYVDIQSGTVGIYAYSESADSRPHLTLTNSRIHNHAAYGLVLQNVDATITNTEITNSASYCVYINGGKQSFVHTTIANYFGYPYSNLNIHSVSRDDVAAVYINNISKHGAPTAVSMANCIVTGARSNNLVVATPFPQYYDGSFTGNYLKADTLPSLIASANRYATDSDTVVFRNIYYLYKEYRYYDFCLDSLSPARGIADSLVASQYPYDRLGIRRKSHPDAGCYEFTE